MKITHKEALTFIVESSHSGEIYEVQLGTNRPHGWCSCPDYEFRQRAKQRHDQRHALVPERCKHIVAVREHVVDRVIQGTIDARTKAAQENLERAKANRPAFQANRGPSTHRPATMREMQAPPINRPPPRDPPVSRPAAGVGAGQSYGPLPRVPQLGQGQPGRSLPAGVSRSVNPVG